MKTQDIKNIASAYKQVLEKKLDPVNPDELKGTHAQRKDKDIDNDGDVDKSDEYLHNRRKAIKTAMKKEEVELDEADMKSQQRALQGVKAQPKDKVSVKPAPWDKKKDDKMNESRWPILQRIMEKRADHVKGATPPEAINSKASQGEKDFVNMHGGLNGNDSGIDGAKAAADTARNAVAQVKVAPKRPNDQTIGDKTMPKNDGK